MDDLKRDEAQKETEIVPYGDMPRPVTPPSIPMTAAVPAAQEEYAAEINKDEPQLTDRAQDDAEPVNRTWGWVALMAAVISLFISPVIFGTASIVLGIIAYFQGTRSLGGWSIALGLVAVFAYLFLAPHYT
jgi:uncharacterized membrane protein YdbT with pleckstrin-like domain